MINLKMKLLIKENPAINANEIAKALNISPESVRYRIKAMKKTGEIQRKGSTKKGEWIITEMVTPQNTKALRELKLWKRAGNQKQDSLSVER